jgi:hypothetical protein
MQSANLPRAVSTATGAGIRSLSPPSSAQTIFLVDRVHTDHQQDMLQQIPDATFLAFDELDQKRLEELRPKTVVAPLVRPGFDAVEVAQRLDRAGYGGLLIVVAEDCPNPELVVSEIRQFHPQLRCAMIQLDKAA